MDSNIIVGIIGVAGILLGSILGGIGYLVRANAEKRKVINYNIFNLFQIWHNVNILEKFDSDAISSWYLNKFKNLISNETLNEQQNKDFHQLCSNVLGQAMMSFIKITDVDMKQSYLNGVMELSKVKPVLAYELSNNSLIKDFLDNFEHFINALLRNLQGSNQVMTLEGFDNGLHAGVQASKQWVTKDFSKDLRRDISRLALASGILTWVTCKIKIRKQIKKLDGEKLQRALDKYIEEAVKPLLGTMKR